MLVGVGDAGFLHGLLQAVCPVSRPGLRVALRLPLRKGLRIALRKRVRKGLCQALRPGVRPALRRRVMGGLGLPKFLGMLLGLLGKVGMKVPPRRGQQSLGEAW